MDNVKDTIKSVSSTPATVFALGLFFRWVLRCAATLSLPVPAGSKAQIHAAILTNESQQRNGGPVLPLPAPGAAGGGGGDHGPIHQWLSSLVPLALKGLRTMVDLELACSLPSLDCVVLEKNVVTLKVDDLGGKKKPSKSNAELANRWKWQSLYDLSRYYLCFEDYGQVRHCLTSMTALKPLPAMAKEEWDIFKGMLDAIGNVTDSPGAAWNPSFQHCTPSEAKQMLKLCESTKANSVPFYWRLNYELLSTYHLPKDDDKTARALSSKNVASRVELAQPPSAGAFSNDAIAEPSSSSSKFEAKKRRMLMAMRDPLKAPKEWSEKIVLTPRLSEAKSR